MRCARRMAGCMKWPATKATTAWPEFFRGRAPQKRGLFRISRGEMLESPAAIRAPVAYLIAMRRAEHAVVVVFHLTMEPLADPPGQTPGPDAARQTPVV